MKKEATDFALLASAFARDEQMARQVCQLLADGDVQESVARKMLALVRDGKLQTQTQSVPWYVYQPYRWTYTNNFPVYATGGTLTTTAQALLSNGTEAAS
jgi:hypothetical protein